MVRYFNTNLNPNSNPNYKPTILKMFLTLS